VLAWENTEQAGVKNAEFLEGRIEDVPLPDSSIDVVMSNCVIGLSARKDKVFGEAFRVLRPGGRLAVADVVANNKTDTALSAGNVEWAACLAGAATRDQHRAQLISSGFVDIEITDSHEVGDGLWSVFVRARKP
jgi:arsenite methyltransferase